MQEKINLPTVEVGIAEVYQWLNMCDPLTAIMTFDQKVRFHRVLNKWVNGLISDKFIPSDKNCKNCDLFNSTTGECAKWRMVVPLDKIIKSEKCPDYKPQDYVPF